MTITLQQINVYPVKSLRGVSTDIAGVEARGLRHDRRWMVVDGEGKFLTQRELPRMACVSAAVETDHLMLTAPNMPALSVPLVPPFPAERVSVRVWRSVCESLAVGLEADTWLSRFLEVSCRLVYMPDTTRRAVNPDFAAGEGVVSFADGYPLMVIGQASLDDLNGRLEASVPMSRFRPSLVLSGGEAYAEDGWRSRRIGDVLFHAVKPCERCVMTTVDQENGLRTGSEPLKTLASYRLRDHKVLFGMYLIPDGDGTLRVDDPVEVLQHGTA